MAEWLLGLVEVELDRLANSLSDRRAQNLFADKCPLPIESILIECLAFDRQVQWNSFETI